MDTLRQDLAYALRSLRRNPAFALVIVATLALGIGANTAIFSVVDAMLLRPLPYPHPEQLVTVRQGIGARAGGSLPYESVRQVEAEHRLFQHVAAYRPRDYNLAAPDGPRVVHALLVTPGFFPLLGVAPRLGRGFAPREARTPVVVLSHNLWQDAYGSDPGIVGRAIVLDGATYTVVGVMPAGFAFHRDDIALWVPLAGAFAGGPEWSSNLAHQFFPVVARLRPDLDPARARPLLDVVAARIGAADFAAGYAAAQAAALAASGKAGRTPAHAVAGRTGQAVTPAVAGGSTQPVTPAVAGGNTQLSAPAVAKQGARPPGLVMNGRGAPTNTPGHAVPPRPGRASAVLPPSAGMGAPEQPAPHLLTLVPLRDEVVGPIRDRLLLLFAAVGLVLLIACANVAGLLLARATSRRRELAIRRALGAARGRLARQLLTESALLSLLAGAGGVLLAGWGLRAALALWPGTLPRVEGAAIDARVLVFTLLVSLATGLLFGLLPALRATTPGLEATLKDEARAGTPGRPRLRAQATLVVAETALALMLLVGAGLLVRSFLRLSAVRTGFDPSDVVAARVHLDPASYATAATQRQFFQALLESLRANPEVRHAAVTRSLPFTGGAMLGIVAPALQTAGAPLSIRADFVTAGYFRALRIPRLRGRTLDARDLDSARVVVINQALADRLWPGEDPVGRTLPLPSVGGRTAGPEVVGVVGNTRDNQFTDHMPARAYLPASGVLADAWVVVRARRQPLALVPAIRAAVAGVDPRQPVAEVVALEQLQARSTAAQRFSMTLVAAFAALALALALVGVHSLTSFGVTQRTRELGIRFALGARYRDVLRMLLREGLVLTAIGVSVGLALSYAFARLLAGMLFGIQARDPLTFVAAALLLGAAALLACYFPARRAARADPMAALRME